MNVTLTNRERVVLHELSAGGTLDTIAKRLHVSRNTVKTQTRTLYRKLGVTSRIEAVQATQREPEPFETHDGIERHTMVVPFFSRNPQATTTLDVLRALRSGEWILTDYYTDSDPSINGEVYEMRRRTARDAAFGPEA